MQIEHIIFLIHPCCYESLTHAEVARDNLQFYVELERKVKTRWLGVLAERPQSTLMVQLGGPEDLSDQAIKQDQATQPQPQPHTRTAAYT